MTTLYDSLKSVYHFGKDENLYFVTDNQKSTLTIQFNMKQLKEEEYHSSLNSSDDRILVQLESGKLTLLLVHRSLC